MKDLRRTTSPYPIRAEERLKFCTFVCYMEVEGKIGLSMPILLQECASAEAASELPSERHIVGEYDKLATPNEGNCALHARWAGFYDALPRGRHRPNIHQSTVRRTTVSKPNKRCQDKAVFHDI